MHMHARAPAHTARDMHPLALLVWTTLLCACVCVSVCVCVCECVCVCVCVVSVCVRVCE